MSQQIQHHKDKSSVEHYKVRRDLKILAQKKGYHTELVSLYIPPERPISAVVGYLRNELSESSNIKSKTTRKRVLDAIRSLIETLRVMKNPENGLILFDGFPIGDGGPGTEKEEKYIIIPPEPVQTFRYHCAAEFLLEPLEDLMKDKSTVGLISIGRKEAAIGTLRGKNVTVVHTMTSGIHGKHRAGGQSQRRFERLIEEAAREFYKRIGEHANQIFSEIEDLEGIIVGGPGYSKYEFLDGPFLREEFKSKVLDKVDTDADGEYGIRRMLQQTEEILRETEFMKEKKVFTKFMGEISRDTGMVTYGLYETIEAVKAGAVETLLLSEEVNKVHILRKCGGCDKIDDFYASAEEYEKKMEEISEGECPECNSGYVSATIETKDLIEYFSDEAKMQGTEVKIMSTDTEEGKSFFDTFGGIGGFLRYKYIG